MRRQQRVVVLALLAAISACGYLERNSETNRGESAQLGELNEGTLAAMPYFVMADNLMCEISQSSRKSEVGKRISLIGLTTASPKALYDSGVTSPLRTEFESDKAVTFVLVASGTGSVDSLILNKEKGTFARITAAAPILGADVDAIASLGSCR